MAVNSISAYIAYRPMAVNSISAYMAYEAYGAEGPPLGPMTINSISAYRAIAYGQPMPPLGPMGKINSILLYFGLHLLWWNGPIRPMPPL
jgi:hypothetical protein